MAQAEAKLAAWRQRTRGTFKVPAAHGEGRRLRVTLQAPCTLWGRQWLGLQGYMHNDHDVMVRHCRDYGPEGPLTEGLLRLF
jgi:hypothetical protein